MEINKKKYSFLVCFISLFSCNSVQNSYKLDKNEPIVDYNNSYEYYDNAISFNKAIERTNKQTVILYDKKEIERSKLSDFLENKSIKSIEKIKDSIKISELGYSYKDVKTVVDIKSK